MRPNSEALSAARTEAIPAVDSVLARTQSLPVVPAADSAPGRPPRRGGGRLVAAGLGLLLVGGAAGAGLGLATRDGATARPSATADAPVPAGPLEATLSSFDPSGGTGLRDRASGWVTVTYKTAAFGNLKPGVGLLVDLSTARAVQRVTFEAGPGPIVVELRAADAAGASAEDFTPAGEPVTTSGATVLEAGDAGSHRYWLVWVSELAPGGGGYQARLSDVEVLGS